MANDWLKTPHPLYEQRKEEWLRNERRLRGGMAILPELRRFDWETLPGEMVRTQENRDVVYLGVPGEHYESRQRMAVYVNFMESIATTRVGHLFKKRPTPEGGLDFAGLGEVRRERDTARPTRAELLYYNADGVGNDGSQWDNFWAKVAKWAMSTGHRWLMVETPRSLPGGRPFAPGAANRRDEILGFRPYLVHRSPLSMLNWHYEDGRLAFCVWERMYRNPIVERDSLEGNEPRRGWRLMVRTGYAALGDEWAGGGWWDFDENGDLVPGAAGDWTDTLGEIPVWPHFYERDEDEFSRSGLTELGNAAIQYMNLDSAATYDAWDAAASLQFILGADPSGFNEAMNKVRAGAKWIPLQTNPDTNNNPQVYDASTGAVVSSVFQARLDTIRQVVQELEAMELTSVPDSSGISKQMGFAESKSPRLALMASEMEASMNTALFHLEQRWGINPPGASVVWTRDFDLTPVMDRVTAFFELENLAQLRSPTADRIAMSKAVKEAGIVVEGEDAALIEDEYEAASQRNIERQAQLDALVGEYGRAPEGEGGEEDLPPAPNEP